MYHINNHTCTAALPGESATEFVKEALRTNPRSTPGTMQKNAILSAIRARKSPEELEKVVSSVGSKRKIANEKTKQKKLMYPEGCSFAAVKSLKEIYFDGVDPFLIYKIDENDQIVFKTSKEKMEIAGKVCGKNSFLSNEYCSFDGKVKRTKGFTTLTASVYHPFLQEQVPLGTMECISEDEESVSRYWKIFNEAYKEANKTTGKISHSATQCSNNI